MLTLKPIRKAAGLSVPALSRLSGVSVRTIEEMEQRKDCKLSTAIKVARALNVNVEALWQD